jgi:O-antigen/teichoic acid export membrane protein
VSKHQRPRPELFTNTIAAWSWAQLTLAVSILTLPLMTRFLSADEFGLWTELLSLSALATVADVGMSAVFLRRMTDQADAGRASIMRSTTAFYRAGSAILTAGLLIACLVPGGLLSPYLAHTKAPVLTAILVIIPIGVNLRCQSWTLELLNEGRVDLERIFGAGPAVIGTFTTTLAAYEFGTALAVAASYSAVEVTFDVALILVAVARRPPVRRRIEPGTRTGLASWRRLWHESTGVLVINMAPRLSMPLGIAVVGYAAGPVAAATYGLAWKASSVLQRFFTPFTDSLFVSLCRATTGSRPIVAKLAVQLSTVALTGGATAAFIVVCVGGTGMRLVFGSGYGSTAWILLILLISETIRSMCRPFLRKIQSENGIGSMRYWFIASLAAQIPLSIMAAERWSAAGAAAAVLGCAAIFEAAPVASRLSAYHHANGARGRPVLSQALAVIGTASLLALLAWERQRLGPVVIAAAAAAAATTGLLTVRQIARYLAAVRPVTSASLVSEPRGQET